MNVGLSPSQHYQTQTQDYETKIRMLRKALHPHEKQMVFVNGDFCQGHTGFHKKVPQHTLSFEKSSFVNRVVKLLAYANFSACKPFETHTLYPMSDIFQRVNNRDVIRGLWNSPLSKLGDFVSLHEKIRFLSYDPNKLFQHTLSMAIFMTLDTFCGCLLLLVRSFSLVIPLVGLERAIS